MLRGQSAARHGVKAMIEITCAASAEVPGIQEFPGRLEGAPDPT